MIFSAINIFILRIRKNHLFMDIDHRKERKTKQFLITTTHVENKFWI